MELQEWLLYSFLVKWASENWGDGQKKSVWSSEGVAE